MYLKTGGVHLEQAANRRICEPRRSPSQAGCFTSALWLSPDQRRDSNRGAAAVFVGDRRGLERYYCGRRKNGAGKESFENRRWVQFKRLSFILFLSIITKKLIQFITRLKGPNCDGSDTQGEGNSRTYLCYRCASSMPPTDLPSTSIAPQAMVDIFIFLYIYYFYITWHIFLSTDKVLPRIMPQVVPLALCWPRRGPGWEWRLVLSFVLEDYRKKTSSPSFPPQWF